MRRANKRRRAAIALALVSMLLACGTRALAQDPSLQLSQYAHTAWRVRDGFFKGAIWAIAQTPDGYLWLGTEFGLVRFDGVRTVPWQPPTGLPLLAGTVSALLTGQDGTLWIGSKIGLASWKDGHIKQYPQLAGQNVLSIIEDHEHTVWVGSTAIPAGRLCAIRHGSVNCYGGDGSFGAGVEGLYEDTKGHLWAQMPRGLWRWKPGNPKFYPMPDEPTSIPVGEDEDGALLIRFQRGITRFVDGKLEPYRGPSLLRQATVTKLLRDRGGALWVATYNGVAHVYQGRTDVFGEADGLSGNNVQNLFEDREGNVWVATRNGLDRFRDVAVRTLRAKQGFFDGTVTAILAATDGSLWLGRRGGLFRHHNDKITPMKNQDDLNGSPVLSLFQDRRGRIWVSTLRAFGYLENDRFVPMTAVPGGLVHFIAEDSAGDIWISNENRGLIRLRNEAVEQIPWTALGRKDSAWSGIVDPLQGGLWLGFFHGGVAYFAHGAVRTWYSAENGLAATTVNDFKVDQDGAVWVATSGGLSRLKNGRVVTLTSRDGLPCDAVLWIVKDVHSFWLYMPCGLARVARSEVDGWATALEKDNGTKRSIQVTLLDSSDGVRSLAYARQYGPQVARTADGRLWFLATDGVSVVDPARLPFNQLPPPVYIEQIAADRVTYDPTSGVQLPPLVRDLQIDYAALSLAAPEKNRFRIRLDGRDSDWQDVGARRQAFYTDLGPGSYRFRVIASNNSGVWNETGGALEFSIAPAYYQTRWFQAVVAVSAFAVLWLAYLARVRQVSREYHRRLDERVHERTRIARELHDTLLQSFHGVLLHLQTASYLLAERPAEAKEKLDGAIDYAAKAITEGRDAVQGLRSSTVEGNDLALAIRTVGDELATGAIAHPPPAFRVGVEGHARHLRPIVHDEIYKIAGEAVRNSFAHAQAGQVEVEIRYDGDEFRLRVRDDGKGIDQTVLAGHGVEGHYGLRGMPERAALIGGKLALWSEVGAGTEVELRIPASAVYATARRRSWWSRLSASRMPAEERGEES